VSKGGYNKLFKKFQEATTDNLTLRSELIERNQTISELRATASIPTEIREEKPKSKLREVWTSTPVWGAIGVLAALIISPFSVKFMYALVWLVLCVEFIRIKFGETGLRRYAANAIFAVGLLATMIIGWPYLPKPKEEPNFDAALARFGDKLPEKIAARVEADNSKLNPSAANQSVPPPPDRIPNFSVGPELLTATPVVELIARNDYGANIEMVKYNVDYFVADMREGEPYSSIRFIRYHHLNEFPLLPADQFVFREGASYPFKIPLSPISVNNGDAVFTELMKEESGVKKIPGVRIVFKYERSSDHRSFSFATGYEYLSNDNYKTLSFITTGFNAYNSPAKAESADITDIKKYLTDASKWEEANVKITTDQLGKPTVTVLNQKTLN
jgi:hypothetical protein